MKQLIAVLFFGVQIIANNSLIIVPFVHSMSPSINFHSDSIQYADWRVIVTLYNNCVLNYNRFYQEQPRIPKIIHQIWLGSSLPERCRELQKSWQEKHPDWRYILWTDEEVQAFGLQNKKIYNASKNWGEKSDIARYEILYRIGGLYIDTDFECLKPFDIFHHCFDFYTAVGYSKEVQLWNGLIGSVPGHPILKKVIDSMQDQPAKDVYQIFHTTGAFLYTRCFYEVLPMVEAPIAIFPVTYFYPWPNYARDEKDGTRYIKPESYGIHHWHRSWFK